MSNELKTPNREPDFKYICAYFGCEFYVEESVVKFDNNTVFSIREDDEGQLTKCDGDMFIGTFIGEIQGLYKEFVFEKEFLTDD